MKGKVDEDEEEDDKARWMRMTYKRGLKGEKVEMKKEQERKKERGK